MTYVPVWTDAALAVVMKKAARVEGSDCAVWTGPISHALGFPVVFGNEVDDRAPKFMNALAFMHDFARGRFEPRASNRLFRNTCGVVNAWCVNPDHFEYERTASDLEFQAAVRARKFAA